MQVRLSTASPLPGELPQEQLESIDLPKELRAARAAEDIAILNARSWEFRATESELRAIRAEAELASARKLVMEGLHVAGRLQGEVTSLKAQLVASQSLVKQLQDAAVAKDTPAPAPEPAEHAQQAPPEVPGRASMVEKIKKEIEAELKKELVQQVRDQVRTEMRPPKSAADGSAAVPNASKSKSLQKQQPKQQLPPKEQPPPPSGPKPPLPQEYQPFSIPSNTRKPPPPPGAPPPGGKTQTATAPACEAEKNLEDLIPPWLKPTSVPKEADLRNSKNSSSGKVIISNPKNGGSRHPRPPREAPICYDSDIGDDIDRSAGQGYASYDDSQYNNPVGQVYNGTYEVNNRHMLGEYDPYCPSHRPMVPFQINAPMFNPVFPNYTPMDMQFVHGQSFEYDPKNLGYDQSFKRPRN